MTRETQQTRFRTTGFTLVELLAVMLVLAIVTALVIWNSRPTDGVLAKTTKANMQIIMTAILEYRQAREDYPPRAGWVSELADTAESGKVIAQLGDNTWNATDNKEFLDAWGNAIAYTPDGGLGGSPSLTSAGPDGDIDTEGDNVRFGN